MNDEERRSLIADEIADDLDEREAEELAFLAELLADSSTWAEPRAGLEDEVVAVVQGVATPITHAPSARRRMAFALPLVAAAAIAALIFGVAVVAGTNSGPDYKAQLNAAGAVAGARGSAEMVKETAGFRIVLDARGLPPLPQDHYYAAWLKDDEGERVPIGTFSSSRGRVTLWSGVSPREYMAMSVTIEDGHSEESSPGPRVLTGTVQPG